jgi:DNA modification methylase
MNVLPTLADNSVEMVLTDIPYGFAEYFGATTSTTAADYDGHAMRNLNKGVADAVTFALPEFAAELVRVCSGSIYVFCGMGQVSELGSLFVRAGLKIRLGVWEKTNPSPLMGQFFWLSAIECCVFARKPSATFNEHCKSSVWREAVTHSKIHPTQKPVKLFQRLILASSAPDDVVLDPCMGSGTAGVACHISGREFIGVEKDQVLFEAGAARIRDTESQPFL